MEGSTPTVCQSRDDGRLGMEGERSNKISNKLVRAGLKLIPPGPFVLSLSFSGLRWSVLCILFPSWP